MNKRERDEQISRNFWDSVQADHLMSIIKFGLRSDTWRSDMMEAHSHLVWYFAHDENRRLDFSVKHGLSTAGLVATAITGQSATH